MPYEMPSSMHQSFRICVRPFSVTRMLFRLLRDCAEALAHSQLLGSYPLLLSRLSSVIPGRHVGAMSS